MHDRVGSRYKTAQYITLFHTVLNIVKTTRVLTGSHYIVMRYRVEDTEGLRG